MKYQFDILFKYLLFCYILLPLFALFLLIKFDMEILVQAQSLQMDYKIKLYTFFAVIPV